MKPSAYRCATLVVSLTCTFAAMGSNLQSVHTMQTADLIAGRWSLLNGQLHAEINGHFNKSHLSLVNGQITTLQNDSALIVLNKNISPGINSQHKALGIPLTPAITPFPGADIDLLTPGITSFRGAGYNFLQNDSTPLPAEVVRRRTKIIAGASVAGYGLGMAWLYHAWYKDYPQGKFHSFNDIGEWKGIDKLGHTYSAYAESKASMELWRWTGVSRKKRIWLGGMSGAFYQTVIEVLDGFSTEWGWSWGDFAANIAGSGLLVAQELAWDEQRVQMKWSFHRKHYADPTLNQRSSELFGNSTAERFLKDYNGQTYWLSTSLQPFFPGSNLPPWLQVSIGTGAEGLFGGYENVGRDKDGNVNFSRNDIERRRQWYLAPDINLTKIKTNKKGIRFALQVLNIVKFPTPSLELSGGKLSWNWLTF